MYRKMSKRRATVLIMLCWLAYTMAYLGRLNYSANLVRIIDDFQITKAEGGAVASFFFFAYGAGQLIHGLLNKYYNPRWAISLGLGLSAVWNAIFPFCGSLWMMELLWMLNGLTQAVLWSTLTRTLGMYLDEYSMKRSIIIMGTTTACGTVFSYAFSAVLSDWRISFYFASAVLFTVALVWFFAYRHTTENAEIAIKTKEATQKSKGMKTSGFFALFGVILLFAVLNNLIKDGLTTWTPTVFYELFNMSDSLSILLTLGLPMLAILGSTVCVFTNRFVKDHVLLCGVFYAVSCVALLLLVLLLPLKLWWLTLISFALSSLMMSAINNVITSLMPLQMRNVSDPGRIAGTTNAFCYVGSTISSYSLGALADASGWNGVFYLLLGLTLFSLLVCGVYLLFLKKRIAG